MISAPRSKFIAALFLITCMWLEVPAAQTDKYQDSSVFRSSIVFEAGYFTARRERFRELYSNGAAGAVCFERKISSKIAIGGRLMFNVVRWSDTEMDYWSLGLAPYIARVYDPDVSLRFPHGVGVGVINRNVWALYEPRDIPDEVTGIPYRVSQGQASFFGMLFLGVDLQVSPKVTLGGRVYFDYHFGGDPKVGDFGDTGGFSFVGRLGIGVGR